MAAYRKVIQRVAAAFAQDIEPDISKPHVKPLRLHLSGLVGTGKSLVIDAICAKLNEIYAVDVHKSDSKPVVCKMAPTGIAADNIGASTIHQCFKLRVQQTGKAKDGLSKHGESYQERLKSHVIVAMRNAYRHILLWIIDEISMVSNIMLAKIERRFGELYPAAYNTSIEEWDLFAAQNILVVSDWLQLPPVKAGFAFERADCLSA